MLTRDMCCCCTVARGRWTVRRLDYPSKRLKPYWVATTSGPVLPGSEPKTAPARAGGGPAWSLPLALVDPADAPAFRSWLETTCPDQGDDDRAWVMFDTWAEAFAYADRKARGRA